MSDEALRQSQEEDATRVVPGRARGEEDATRVVPGRVRGGDDATRVVPRKKRLQGPPPPEPQAPELYDPEATADAVRRGKTARPSVYGARSDAAPLPHLYPDEVTRAIGPPPPAGPPSVVAPRAELPSLERRFARARVATLAAYGGVSVVCIVGLWLVARLAFG